MGDAGRSKEIFIAFGSGKTAATQCLGVLYDKAAGKAVWFHDASGTYYMGGSVLPGTGVAPDDHMVKMALLKCTIEGLFSQLPPKK
jgi:hypothetical protein